MFELMELAGHPVNEDLKLEGISGLDQFINGGPYNGQPILLAVTASNNMTDDLRAMDKASLDKIKFVVLIVGGKVVVESTRITLAGLMGNNVLMVAADELPDASNVKLERGLVGKIKTYLEIGTEVQADEKKGNRLQKLVEDLRSRLTE